MQPVLQRKRDLRSTCTSPDDDDAEHTFSREQRLLDAAPAGQERLHGAHRNGALGARDTGTARYRPDVDGEDVEGHRRAPVAMDEAAFEIEAGRARMVQPGLCEAAQLAQIDVAGGVIVAPRKHAGQHAGVGRIGIARDEREPGPCLRPHPEIA